MSWNVNFHIFFSFFVMKVKITNSNKLFLTSIMTGQWSLWCPVFGSWERIRSWPSQNECQWWSYCSWTSLGCIRYKNYWTPYTWGQVIFIFYMLTVQLYFFLSNNRYTWQILVFKLRITFSYFNLNWWYTY